jgi:alkanesulfonate monooxygenase
MKVFTTIRRVEGETYDVCQLNDYLKQNEQYGFCGLLFFQSNSTEFDPWTVAQDMMAKVPSLCPFIAVNPVYMHPYTVAKMVYSLGKLYQRKVYLNFIAGTTRSDMESLKSYKSHEDRYRRLAEYIQIVAELLKAVTPYSFSGEHYSTKNLSLPYLLPKNLLPEFFIAGSSDGANMTRSLTGARKLEMAKAMAESDTENLEAIHFGVFSCATTREAEQKLSQTFDTDTSDSTELLELSMSNTDAVWKQQLTQGVDDHIFRLQPFKNFQTDCPYLVGSHEDVAQYITKYIDAGARTFIVETAQEDLVSLHAVMDIVKNKRPGV